MALRDVFPGFSDKTEKGFEAPPCWASRDAMAVANSFHSQGAVFLMLAMQTALADSVSSAPSAG